MVSWGIGAAVFALLLPTLARSPQSGDGAELVAIALRGGVPHPPGFPLQAWLDRVLAHLPGLEPALAIAALGLLAHAVTAALLAETLRRLGVRAAGRVLASFAYACFPPLWALAVQPEVFALAHLLVAAALLAAVRLGAVQRPSARATAGLGLIGSLGLAQHPVFLAALPAIAAGAWTCLRSPASRFVRAALLATSLVLPGVALYLSLPALRSGSPWPDWGALRSAGDVVHHALRADYGTYALSAETGAAASWALPIWLGDLARVWNVGLLLVALGAFTLMRRRELRPALFPVLGTLAAGAAILVAGRLPEQSYSREVLEHLQGPATFAAAVLLGIGCESLCDQLRGPRARRALDALVVLAAAAWLLAGWAEADASHDRTLDLYARGIALELPRDAAFVTMSDIEVFLGAHGPEGTRYPISAAAFPLEWYRREVIPRLDPMLAGGGSRGGWGDMMRSCLARGRPAASSSDALIATPLAVPELRGLIFLARPGATTDLTRESVAAALRLVPLAERLPDLPSRGHAFTRFYSRRFGRAYAGAAEALRREGQAATAARAEAVAQAILGSAGRADRNRLLAEFASACRDSGIE